MKLCFTHTQTLPINLYKYYSDTEKFLLVVKLQEDRWALFELHQWTINYALKNYVSMDNLLAMSRWPIANETAKRKEGAYQKYI